MAQVRVRARSTEQDELASRPRQVSGATPPPLKPQLVKVVPRQAQPEVKVRRKSRPHPHEEETERRLATHRDDPRFQHELKEMQEEHDLDEIDDDVEDVATLYEWEADEHTHRPKSPLWYSILALGTTVVIAIQLYLLNFFGALTIGAVAGLIYYVAQQRPGVARYRIMIDGIAINNMLYHWQDLETFNVCYEPDRECKTVIFRGSRMLSPHIHMEIGDADPVEIRDILIEFMEEDQEMEEPLVDQLARRLGF